MVDGPRPGLLRTENRGAGDGQSSLIVLDQAFLLHGNTDTPSDRLVEVTGLLYVEPTRMPVFGFPNPRALLERRSWLVEAVRRKIVPRTLARGRSAPRAIDRLPGPEDVDTGSYYFVDLSRA